MVSFQDRKEWLGTDWEQLQVLVAQGESQNRDDAEEYSGGGGIENLRLHRKDRRQE